MYCRYDDLDYDHAILSYGDVGGGVCIIEFTDATGSLFGVSTSAKNGTNSKDIVLHNQVMCLCM